MLNSGGNLSGNPWGAILILIGSISWAFGSVYGSRITLPVGMMAGAIEMLAAGVVLMIASMIAGEKLTALPSLSGFLAVGYLALFGSIIAINAYMYLIRNVSPVSPPATPTLTRWSRSCWVRDWVAKRCRRLNGWRSA